ncbi:MAG: hypothetical protein KC431_24530, partial [Myxococcales bacterium]|nr:hypothetical protein [Myxococcales bacterium]
VYAELGQTLKIPHMRNFYTRVGAFGFAEGDAFFSNPWQPHNDFSHQGDQVRGFGYAHDGSKDSLLRIFNGFTFSPFGFQDLETMEAVASFLLAMDSNLAPVVGQQHTLRKQDLGKPQAWAKALARINLLEDR